jgi:hypothetical protein
MQFSSLNNFDKDFNNVDFPEPESPEIAIILHLDNIIL